MECWISDWTVPKQEVAEAVRETWPPILCESGKDEYVRTNTGPETAYWRGTEFSRMGGYDFPGQIVSSDGSEDKGLERVLSYWRILRQQDLSVWSVQKRVQTRRGRK